MDWVIDTDVLARANDGDESHDHCFNVLQLLGTIRMSGHVIVVDDEGKVDREYRRNLDPAGMVNRLLIRLGKNNQMRYVSGRLTNRIERELRRLRFDSDDDVFVAVASRTSTGRLVAEESDYSTSVVDYLASEGIRVINCEVALAGATG